MLEETELHDGGWYIVSRDGAAPVHRIVRGDSDLDVTVEPVGGGGPDGGYAVTFGKVSDNCLVRIHSRCFYGESLGIDGCDRSGQLSTSVDLIQHEGAGVLVCLEQEGRGAGMMKKAQAHRLSQMTRRDTFECYELLGFPVDYRSYVHAAQFIVGLGVHRIRLLTNNPSKVEAVRDCGIAVDIVRRIVPVPVAAHPYLRAKHRRGHWIYDDPPDGFGNPGAVR